MKWRRYECPICGDTWHSPNEPPREECVECGGALEVTEAGP